VVARKGWSPPAGAEMPLAFAVGAGWFALSTVLLAKPLPDSLVVTVGVVVLDVLVVLAIAHYWDIPYTVTVGVASVVALDWYYIPPTHPTTFPDARNLLALTAYLLMAALLGELAVLARRRALLSEGVRSELEGEQAALRRVATLVARETAPEEVFAAVTEEAGKLLRVDISTMLRYETDATSTVVAAWSESHRYIPVGTRVTLEGDNVADAVRRTGRAARLDSLENASGSLATTLRELGVRSSAGSPITVAGSVWGVMVAAFTSGEPIAAGTEARLFGFTELAATAVSNAQTRTELTASRTRIITAADEARRHIERDLHDGVQQRLVSLALGLRLAADVAREGADIRPQLSQIEEGLVGAVDNLRELSHGIHPAILSEGGLRPALAALARRSAVPVELSIRGPDRLPEPIEVGIYYVVSEALTNVAKHAQASVVDVALETDDSLVRLTVRDDGVGGADDSHGTGLIGLGDRIHVLGGRIEITSPSGSGTSVLVSLPLEPEQDGSSAATGQRDPNRLP
jgi:signal transduction histidine kinase